MVLLITTCLARWPSASGRITCKTWPIRRCARPSTGNSPAPDPRSDMQIYDDGDDEDDERQHRTEEGGRERRKKERGKKRTEEEEQEEEEELFIHIMYRFSFVIFSSYLECITLFSLLPLVVVVLLLLFLRILLLLLLLLVLLLLIPFPSVCS